MTELWKDIPGYENLYQASNLGNIRSVEGKTTCNSRFNKRVWHSRIIKPKKRNRTTGMFDPRVDLWKDGKHRSLLVSRLVAKTWCNGYKEELTVNHIDGNPLNNTPENLEWITKKENIQKGFKNGLYKSNQKECILFSNNERFVFSSQYEASRFLGRGDKYINYRISRKINKAYSKDGAEYEILMPF